MDQGHLINILSELTHARLTKRQRALVKEMSDEIMAARAGRAVGWKCPNCAQYNARVCFNCGYGAV